MAPEQTFLTALHGVILAAFAAALIFAAKRVSNRRNTYNAWLLPFVHFSYGFWIFWVLQYVLLVADPLLSFPRSILQHLSLWLVVVQNAFWASAILSLHSKHFSRVSRTLPLLVMFSIGIAIVITYQTTVLSSIPFLIIGAVSAAAIFTVLSVSIVQLPLSKLIAATFFVHGYFQWAWHYLGLTSLSQTQLVLFAFALWHFTLLVAWVLLTSEMLVTFRVMISSTVNDLVEERAAVDRALRTLNLEGFRAETFGSLPDTPEAICADRAEQCHIFILITGARYGHIIKSRGISVVEFEYEVARAQDSGKILVYIKNGVNREPRLEEFVGRLSDFEHGHVTSSFTTPEDLFNRISRDVTQWLNSARKRLTEQHRG